MSPLSTAVCEVDNGGCGSANCSVTDEMEVECYCPEERGTLSKNKDSCIICPPGHYMEDYECISKYTEVMTLSQLPLQLHPLSVIKDRNQLPGRKACVRHEKSTLIVIWCR